MLVSTGKVVRRNKNIKGCIGKVVTKFGTLILGSIVGLDVELGGEPIELPHPVFQSRRTK